MSLFDKLDRTILRNIHVEHESISRTPDHIEIGQVSKGGVIKVYGDFNDLEAFKLKIDKGIELKNYANKKMYGDNEQR